MSVKLTEDMIKGAQNTETIFGIPASITLGQIMLESGGDYDGGLSLLASMYNNLFGITAGSSWTGKTIYMTNKEGKDGQTYRWYDNKTDSIYDHGEVLNSSRYTQYTKNAKTVQEFAEGIKKGGYATDPDYVSKLMNIINSNNLTKYDGDEWQGKAGNNDGLINTDTGDGKSDNELKWWGDVIVVILSILLIALSIIFLVLAFNGGSVTNVAMGFANKATGGALKKLEKVGK